MFSKNIVQQLDDLEHAKSGEHSLNVAQLVRQVVVLGGVDQLQAADVCLELQVYRIVHHHQLPLQTLACDILYYLADQTNLLRLIHPALLQAQHLVLYLL